MKKIREALKFLERECQLFENSSSKRVEKVATEALAELDQIQERLESEKNYQQREQVILGYFDYIIMSANAGKKSVEKDILFGEIQSKAVEAQVYLEGNTISKQLKD